MHDKIILIIFFYASLCSSTNDLDFVITLLHDVLFSAGILEQCPDRMPLICL